DRFREAVAAVGGDPSAVDPDRDAVSTRTPSERDPLGADGLDSVTAALAAARLADLAAPVVLAAGRFEDARAARVVLDAPVICCPATDV
ncbi:MAG: hypothetical protein ABEJ42_04015, partial [Halobacteriaceae archaeon]